MTMLDIPRIDSTSQAFRNIRARLLIDWDNTGDYGGAYDDVTAGVSQTIIMQRGIDNESQANGTLLSGTMSTALGAYDRALGRQTHVFNPRNPNSPLNDKNPQGVNCQVQYVDNNPRTVGGSFVTQTVIPLWTGRILDITPQSGRRPLVNIRAIGVLGYINDQRITLPVGTFASGTRSLAAVAQVLDMFGIDTVYQTSATNPEGETFIADITIDNQKPLDVIRDFLLSEGGLALELADGRVLLLGRNWRNFNTDVQGEFNDRNNLSVASDGVKQLSFVGDTSQIFESSSTIFNTFYANVSNEQDDVETVGEFRSPVIYTLHNFEILRFSTNPINDLALIRYSNDDTDSARELLKAGTVFIPAGGTTVTTLDVTESGGVPAIGNLGFIDFESRQPISGDRTSLTSYWSDGTTGYRLQNYFGAIETGITQPDIRVFVDRLDDTTVQIAFANLEDKDYLCYNYSVKSSLVANSSITRVALPDDGSNTTSINRYAVQEYPQEPTFIAFANQTDTAIAQARNWARLLYTLYGEPRDIAIIASEPRPNDRPTIEALCALDLSNLLRMETDIDSALYISGNHYIQHIQIEIDPYDRKGVYYFYFTLEPGLEAITPSIHSITLPDITRTTATAIVEIVDPGASSKTVYLRYRETGQQNYSATQSITTTGTSVEFDLTGLTDGTEYDIMSSLNSNYSDSLSTTFTTLSMQVTAERSILVLRNDIDNRNINELWRVNNLSLALSEKLADIEIPNVGRDL